MDARDNGAGRARLRKDGLQTLRAEIDRGVGRIPRQERYRGDRNVKKRVGRAISGDLDDEKRRKDVFYPSEDRRDALVRDEPYCSSPRTIVGVSPSERHLRSLDLRTVRRRRADVTIE